jgi:hypothetical protein
MLTNISYTILLIRLLYFNNTTANTHLHKKVYAIQRCSLSSNFESRIYLFSKFCDVVVLYRSYMLIKL